MQYTSCRYFKKENLMLSGICNLRLLKVKHEFVKCYKKVAVIKPLQL